MNEYIISKNFSSPFELHSAVSSANAPEDIEKLINSKLKDIEKRKKRFDPEDDDTSKLKIIMKSATNKNGILTMNNLIKALEDNSVGNINPENLIHASESEGYIIRSGVNQWTWL
ncbi:MAG: hypothetical protein CMB47_06480 [Euryarchaeota archaeon]|nr:hypothetical protein [Euryarchaeota archaeon]|tara:strand:- start:50500 stop:50844 length:345 start_codon:yes stop_codon:yes gene_type:complete